MDARIIAQGGNRYPPSGLIYMFIKVYLNAEVTGNLLEEKGERLKKLNLY